MSKCVENISGKITTIFRSQLQTRLSTHGGAKKRQQRSQGQKGSKGSRPHERKQRILDRITRNADKLYEAQFRRQACNCYSLSRLTARAIVCRQEQVTDRRLEHFSTVADGVDDSTILSPRRSQTTRLLGTCSTEAFGEAGCPR